MAKKKKESSTGLSDKPKTARELKLEGVQNLYNFLFEACNIIRGPVSHDNFKDYITPILYYKRISDVYDEETLNALQESALEAFDKIFPKKVKKYNESQLPLFAEKAKWLREHGYSLELK